MIPRFITRTLAGKPPVIYGDGNQTRDFTYVKDIVQANVKAMERDAQGVFNVAYNQRTSLLSLVDIITEETGMHVNPVFEPPSPGDTHDSQADISAAQNAFGYAPEYTVRSGLKETIAGYVEKRRDAVMIRVFPCSQALYCLHTILPLRYVS